MQFYGDDWQDLVLTIYHASISKLATARVETFGTSCDVKDIHPAGPLKNKTISPISSINEKQQQFQS